MKILVLGLLICSALISCDNRGDLYREMNKVPTLQVTPNNGWDRTEIWSEDIFDSVKLSNSFYLFKYQVENENPVTAQIFSVGKASDNFLNNRSQGTDIFQEVPLSGSGSIDFSSTGSYMVHLKLWDEYEIEASSLINLVVYDNLPPVAKMKIEHIEQLDPKEYKIDASMSFDRDSAQYGFIRNYNYKVGTFFDWTGIKKDITVIMPDTGSYTVSVRVQDNDGEWSNIVTDLIQVE